MPIRLKVLRRKEQQISKVRDLMDMFHIDRNQYYQYQPIGASTTIDPKIQKTKDLFQMFHIDR